MGGGGGGGYLTLLLLAAALLPTAFTTQPPITTAQLTDPYDLVDAAQQLASRGRHLDALAAFERAVAHAGTVLPRDHLAQVHFNIGFTLQALNRPEEALIAYRAATRLDPRLEAAYVKEAYILKESGRTLAASEALRAAVSATGGRNPQTLGYLGDTLNNMKQFSGAAEAYRAGLTMLRAEVPAARSARGASSGSIDDAGWQVKLRERPSRDLAMSLYASLGDAFVNGKKATEGLSAMLRAASLASPREGPPPALLASMLQARLELVSWEGLEADARRLLSIVAALLAPASTSNATAHANGGGGNASIALGADRCAVQEPLPPPSPLSPYLALFLDVEPGLRAAIAVSWARHTVLHTRAAPLSDATVGVAAGGARGSRDGSVHVGGGTNGRLRVGIISRRFEDYPGTHLLMGILGHKRSRARARIHLSCIASGRDDGSAARVSLASNCDDFIDVSAASAVDAAAAISRRRIDVLLDYDGAHDYNNMGILASRPAAVQTSWLGFAATTGMGKRGAAAAAHAIARTGGLSRCNDGGGGDDYGHSEASSETSSDVLPNDRNEAASGVSSSSSPDAVDYALVDAVIAPPEESGAADTPNFNLRSLPLPFTESLWYTGASYQPQDPWQAMSGPRPTGSLAWELAQQRLCGSSDGGGDIISCVVNESSSSSWLRIRNSIKVAEGLPLRPPPPVRYPGLATTSQQLQRSSSFDGTASTDHDDDHDRTSAPVQPQSLDTTTAPLSAATTTTLDASSASLSPVAAAPIVLVSLNRWSKLDEVMWDTWMGTMGAAPNTVLWLYGGTKTTPINSSTNSSGMRKTSDSHGSNGGSGSGGTEPHIASLRAQAAAHGVHPTRLIFAARAPRPAHLHRHFGADVLLDSSVYGAHTTAADGLFTGLPLVTLPGRGMASRVGASLLRAAAAAPAPSVSSSTAAGSAVAAATSVAEVVGVVHSHMEYANTLAGLSDARNRGAALAAIRDALHARVASVISSQVEVIESGATDAAAAAVHIAPTHPVPPIGPPGWSPVFDAAGTAVSLARAARAAWEAKRLMRTLEGEGADARDGDEAPGGPAAATYTTGNDVSRWGARSWQNLAAPFHIVAQ